MSTRFFITGTDTGVGKTVVATILARGYRAHYWKPVHTGAASGEKTDSDFVRQWSKASEVLNESYVFELPAAPSIAACAAAARIETQKILQDFESIKSSGVPLIVEGAGGVLVPLNEKTLMIDLITQLAIPVLLVADLKLGVINHTLLTIEALRSRSIQLAGLITVGAQEFAMSQAINELSQVPHCGHVPRASHFSEVWFEEMFQRLVINITEHQ
jgi:dethiobiotin synthetase